MGRQARTFETSFYKKKVMQINFEILRIPTLQSFTTLCKDMVAEWSGTGSGQVADDLFPPVCIQNALGENQSVIGVSATDVYLRTEGGQTERELLADLETWELLYLLGLIQAANDGPLLSDGCTWHLVSRFEEDFGFANMEDWQD